MLVPTAYGSNNIFVCIRGQGQEPWTVPTSFWARLRMCFLRSATWHQRTGLRPMAERRNSQAARGRAFVRQPVRFCEEAQYSYRTLPSSICSMHWWCLLSMCVTREGSMLALSNNTSGVCIVIMALLSHVKTTVGEQGWTRLEITFHSHMASKQPALAQPHKWCAQF